MTTIRIANTPADPNDANIKRGDAVMVARGANDVKALITGNVVLPEVTSANKGHNLNVNDSGNVEWVPGYDKNFTPLTLTSGTFQERYRFIVLFASTTRDSNTPGTDSVIMPIIGGLTRSVTATYTFNTGGNQTNYSRKITAAINSAMTTITITKENLSLSSETQYETYLLDYYGVR